MSKTAAFVFFGIIAAGTVASLIYFNMRGEVVEVVETDLPPGKAAVEDPAPAPEKPAPAPAQPAPAEPPAPTEPEAAPTVAAGKIFPSPEAAMKALAGIVGSKDGEAVVALVGEENVPAKQRGDIVALVESPDLSLSSEKPWTEISKSADALRWAMNFVPETGDAGRQLYTDLSVGDDGVSIKALSLPLEIPVAVNRVQPASPGSEPAPAAPAPMPVPDPVGVDALTIAHAFSKAIVARNFPAARALADPASVTDERVAALMIAIEEGGFALKEDRPLVVTLSRDDVTWVLTRVEGGGDRSEFAVELAKIGEAWSVNGLTFSKVLTALADRAGGGDVAYSPIVEDPMGGDSLVLYFEFDESGLSPRANRQLAIIADILSQGADRVIRINGHADALGTDDYNAVLSDRRAEAIRKGLISMGVSPDQVVTESFGASKPRRPNFKPDGSDNPSGRAQNRRAEVYLDF